MKEISVDNLDIIAQGGMGKIYRINNEQILKVFNDISVEDLQRQKETAVEVFKSMVPTPISYEIVKAGGKYGIIYEFLNGSSVGKAIADHPERVREMGEKMGELFSQLHAASIKDLTLEYMNDRVNTWIDRIENTFIKEKDARMLREIIEAIPRGNCVLHCDFHEGNVMIQNGEYVLIDIDEVCIGHPLYDLTYHYINHEFLAKQPQMLLKSTGLTPKLAKQSARITREIYFSAMDKKTERMYKDLMASFVPFLLVMNLGRIGEKADYMSKSSLFILLHVFLPLLRLRKRRFIRDLGFMFRGLRI
ncbi:MAG: phosphotransferase [Eubacterium sp.]|nr:phosphotransferase [Eubacterium sp.]